MASAVEQLVQGSTSENPVSFYDYYNAYGKDRTNGNWIKADPNSLLGRINNWFTGDVDSAKQAYDNYLTSLNQKREDTSYQRSINDIIAAGYNPYMALGSISSSNSAQAYKREKKEDNEGKLVNSALKILALMLIKSL